MKATVIKRLERRRLTLAQQAITAGVPITRVPSRVASIHESLYSNRTSFIQRAARKVGLGGKVHMKQEELKRFSTVQAQSAGSTLSRHPSRIPVAGPSTA